MSDGHGGTGTASTEIDVANGPPTATITAPTAATKWKVGDTISFAGTATDPDQGTLPGSALTWALIMHHCPSDCHAHQITTMTGASGTFTAPDHEYPSYLELKLTARDSGGLSSVKSVRLDPQTVGLTFATQPAGMKVTYFSKTVTAPSTVRRSSGRTGQCPPICCSPRRGSSTGSRPGPTAAREPQLLPRRPHRPRTQRRTCRSGIWP